MPCGVYHLPFMSDFIEINDFNQIKKKKPTTTTKRNRVTYFTEMVLRAVQTLQSLDPR